MILSRKLMMILGGGAFVDPVVVQTATSADTITDPQEGDVVVYMHGYLTNTSTHLVSGFTSIRRQVSNVQWAGSSTSYYTQGHLQYKILTGTETTFNGGSGTGAWVQYRMIRPITSVTLSGTTSANANMSASYSAVTQTGSTLGCIRVVGTGGYTATGTTQTLSTGDVQTVVSSAYAKFLSTHSFDAGSASSTRASFSSPTFYSTLIFNG
jgi:hypothetical protein